jgi:hypothetical protein
LGGASPQSDGGLPEGSQGGYSGKVHKTEELILSTVTKNALGFRRIWVRLADGLLSYNVAVNAVKQKIMCIVLLCCSCCALFNEAAAGSIYMTYL